MVRFRILLAASLLAAGMAPLLAANEPAVNFAAWQSGQWENLRETQSRPPGQWQQEPKCICAGEKEGGLSLLYRPVSAVDLTVTASLAFQGQGKPELLLRAQSLKGVSGDTYAVVLHSGGIELWRRLAGRPSKVAEAAFAARENELYRVRAAAEGWRLRVWVNEVLQLDTVDATLPQAGRAGLRAGAGECRFYEFEVEAKPVPPAGTEPPTWQAGSTSVRTLDKAKPLFLNTPLVANGQPVAAIVAPAGYREMALALQERIRRLSRVEVPVVADTELADAQGRWNSAGLARRDEALVVLGDLESNRLLPLLYARLYTAVDACYPGAGGYVLHTIHDPWGNGHNVVVVGGSDAAGVRAASEALLQVLEQLPAGPHLVLPRLMQFKLAPAVLRTVAGLGKNPDEAAIARAVKQSREAFKRGQHTGVTRDLVRAGFCYARTGLEGYAELYKRLARLMFEIYRSQPTTYGGPWGMDADFNAMQVIASWDNVEESPVFSEAERLEVTRIIAEYAAYVGNFGNARDALRPGIRHNHNTHPCLGLLFAAEYFGKYYHAAEAARWRTNAEVCFQNQALSFKSQEDANGYQWLTLEHMIRYALAKPDHTWFANGNARRVLDLALGTMDNLGQQAPFGDVGGFRGWGNEMRLWAVGAWYLQEPAYRWALEKESVAGGRPRLNVAEYATRRPVGAEPSGYTGARVFPMERRFYDYWAPKAAAEKLWVAPVEQTYEKISFRDSFEAQGRYLLLDGIGTGGHRHFDGNALLRYSDRGREWLADGDYIQALPKFHTSVLVFRDGQSSTLPPFCALEAQADLPGAGMVRSTVRGYGGADWSRNLVWLRNGAVVAIDSLQARVAADYSFRAVWHTLGQPAIQGGRFTLEQQGERLVLENLDGARLKLTEDADLGKNWKGYTNAQPVVRILQQVAGRKLQAGESYHFLNVFGTSQCGGEHPIQVTRALESSVLVTVQGETTLVGVTGGKPVVVAPGIETDAAIYVLRPGGFALAKVTRLVAEGHTLLQASTPVNVEFDAATGRAVVESAGRLTLALGGREGIAVAPGRQEIAIGAAAAQTVRLHLPAPAAVAATQCPASAPVPALPVRWTFPGSFTCMAVGDLDGDKKAETIAGSADGCVRCLGADGKERWVFKMAHGVKAVWAGALGVAAGAEDGSVCLLDRSGKPLWTHTFPYYKREPVVRLVFGADLDGDGKQELICGTESWHFYALDSRGKERWHYEGVHASTCGVAADLDGDGKQEVLAGTEYYWWHAIGPDGKRSWNYRATVGPHANCVATGDLNGDGKQAVVFGGADGNLHALDAAGKPLWKFNTGDEVTGVAVAAGRVFAASKSFNLYGVNGAGKRLWRRDCGDVLNGLALAGSAGQSVIAVAGDDGRVALYGATGMLLSEAKLSGPVLQVATGEREEQGREGFLALVVGRGIVALGTPAAK
jgi:hypothetical protein